MNEFKNIDNQLHIKKEVTETISLDALLSEKKSLEETINIFTTRHNERIAGVEARIDELDILISEANKLGIETQEVIQERIALEEKQKEEAQKEELSLEEKLEEVFEEQVEEEVA